MGVDGAYRGEWSAIRARFLRKHPWCADCGAPAAEPDHVPPRQLLIAAGIHNPDHERWLVPRCKPHHARVTRVRDAPLLRRLRAGEDPAVLAEEAMRYG